MARAVAALPQAERDYFEGMVADERAAARREERIAKLRAMSDEDAVKAGLMNMADSIRWREGHFPRFMRDLKDAGFVRLAGKEVEALKSITAGFMSRADAEEIFGSFPLKLEPGKIEELPAGKAITCPCSGLDLPEAITRVREVIQEIDGMVRRGTISNAPSLRHWLLRALDALTGENHSGFATSLPAPKKVA